MVARHTHLVDGCQHSRMVTALVLHTISTCPLDYPILGTLAPVSPGFLFGYFIFEPVKSFFLLYIVM